MNDSLATILAGAGLAGATGHRAFLPAFLLGLASRIGDGGGNVLLKLSPQFAWLGDTKVLAILGALVLIEYLAEKNPDAPELVNLALKAPKAVLGFIVAAQAVGKIDGNLGLLAVSGLFGSATALGVDSMRASVKHAIQEPLSDATAGASDKAIGAAETGWAGFLSVMSWVIPIVAVLGIGVLVFVWLGRRRIADMNRIACVSCGFRHAKDAKVCAGCKRDITGPAAVSASALQPPSQTPQTSQTSPPAPGGPATADQAAGVAPGNR